MVGSLFLMFLVRAVDCLVLRLEIAPTVVAVSQLVSAAGMSGEVVLVVSSWCISLVASWLMDSCSLGEFSLGTKRILHHVWFVYFPVLIVKIKTLTKSAQCSERRDLDFVRLGYPSY